MKLGRSNSKAFAVATALLALCALAPAAARAQLPPLLSFQGRVLSGNTNFSGPAQFKFALVDGPGATSFWSNDGTSAGGSEPASSVAVPVSLGLYSVLLGDTNMPPVPATVFTNTDVRVRVWFNDGLHGFQGLGPDQRIAAVAYCAMAGTIPDGAITSAKIAAGAVSGSQLLDGSVVASRIADGAVTGSAFALGTFVPNHGVVASAQDNDASLLAAGFVKLRQVDFGDAWRRCNSTNEPAPRNRHSAVWTGTELIVWGGLNDSQTFNSGARYNPALDVWTPTSLVNAPERRHNHSAVWTGTQMLIWGGLDQNLGVPYQDSYYTNGARYNPTLDSWTAMTTAGAPSARLDQTAVWTGSELIVWGGTPGGGGARYRPSNNTWTPVNPDGAPGFRHQHTAVWTGTEMIVWGGWSNQTAYADGGRYNPASDSWLPLSPSGAPAGRGQHTAVWTGSEMIIWGGAYYGYDGLTDGARYNPASDTWAPTTTTGAPGGRLQQTAVWTGSEMIVCGGQNDNRSLNDGGAYEPVADHWRSLAQAGTFTPRYWQTAVWTGTEMIVSGGISSQTGTSAVGSYSYKPTQPLFLYLKP